MSSQRRNINLIATILHGAAHTRLLVDIVGGASQSARLYITLRAFHSDRDEIGETGLAYEHIYMKAWHPERKEVVRFLQIATNPKRTPVLVHCLHGSDRTGTMCAIYRVVAQGWTKEKAIREMTSDKFGFHKVFDNLPEWILELDADAMRKDAGITLAP